MHSAKQRRKVSFLSSPDRGITVDSVTVLIPDTVCWGLMKVRKLFLLLQDLFSGRFLFNTCFTALVPEKVQKLW